MSAVGGRSEWVWRVGAAGAALVFGLALGLIADDSDRNQNSGSTEAASARFPLPSRPAIAAITHALREHPIVAIGESHDLQEAGDFYAALMKSRRFASIADDVVVEFGNARYQHTIDRYLRGEAVASERLSRVWQNTTQIGSWDAPMYRRFFQTLRNENRRREPGRQLRVLLGDPPIKWTEIESQSDWQRIARRREQFMARLIERDANKGRRVLVIAGMAHVTRLGGGVTDQIEASGGSVYVVGIHISFLDQQWQQQMERLEEPALVELADTWIGRLPDGNHLAQDSLNALLYLGPPGSLHLSVPGPSVYRDDSYWRALTHRVKVAYGDSQFNDDVIFGSYSNPIYPDAIIDTSGLDAVRAFSECMRREGVESFPDPQMSFDSFGIGGDDLLEAQGDPQFAEAQGKCSEEVGFGPPPPA